MRSLDEIRAALQSCYTQFEGLCADLSDQDWKAQSLCPDWVVRDVVQHVTSIEAVMAGWLPQDDSTPPPFEKAGAFLEGTDDPAVLAQKVRAVYDERRADLAALTAADLERPSWMPTGRGTYGRFLEIRVFDFWVHERDITTALGRTTDDTGIAVDGRARKVDHLEHPDATVTTDSTTFIQLACGRVDPQAQIDAGRVSWSGDDQIGARAAHNLRFTM